MWLAWEIAAWIAVLCVVIWGVLRGADTRVARITRTYARELSLMFGLYALWQLGGRISVIDQAGAFRRGQQVWDLERLLLLPDEASLQAWLLPHSWLIQASNIYYGGAHVPAIIACLAWLFVRHRDHYDIARNNLTLLTGASVLIQLVAVAPPRFIEETGMVDTGILYNQSVYSSLGYEMAGQLQAMPSIHVGWAFLVGVATWTVGTGWVRWAGPIHAALTFIVVAITGNHYWLDGIVAGFILIGTTWVLRVAWPRLTQVVPTEQPVDVLEYPTV
ncbi:MAG: inositol phosphorylceramide synthase [Actinomycetia bacterium]|nr:inositol phosphorylceramide synthase [Actinomycetes bacterium]